MVFFFCFVSFIFAFALCLCHGSFFSPSILRTATTQKETHSKQLGGNCYESWHCSRTFYLKCKFCCLSASILRSLPCDFELCCKCWDFWCWYRIVYIIIGQHFCNRKYTVAMWHKVLSSLLASRYNQFEGGKNELRNEKKTGLLQNFFYVGVEQKSFSASFSFNFHISLSLIWNEGKQHTS